MPEFDAGIESMDQDSKDAVDRSVRMAQLIHKTTPMLNTIIQTALRNQGITYNLVTGETNPTQGYMVSLPDREVREEVLTPENLIRFIAINADKLAENNKYLGIWQDGNWCLDVSANITHKEEAIKLAKKWNQKAIWDCEKKEAIELKATESCGQK